MKEKLNGILIFSIIFLVLDQFIKLYISGRMILNESIILIKGFLSITLTHNTGAAFSIFSDSKYLLICVGVLAIIGLIFYVRKLDTIDDLDIITYSLLFGGIIGNLIDRIVYGYVIDYLSFNFGSYYFPIFNLADTFIVVSVILLIFRMLREDLWK